MEIKNKKLTRAKIQLQREKPFFAYLIMNMEFIEKPEVKTTGVDFSGNCYYSPEFIEGLSENEIKGVLSHEVLHIILEHLIRLKDKDVFIWNIATDLCVNSILRKNGLSLPDDSLTPNFYNEYELKISENKSITIKNISDKTAEQIYYEIIKELDTEKEKQGIGVKNFDEHIYGEGKQIDKAKTKELKSKWKKIVSEAGAYARERGEVPRDLGIFIDNILNEKINWKTLLYKYLTRTIPHDYSYARPSKRSFSTGCYMPIMRKENIEIVVSLDTSGSIQGEELKDFMSEINGIAKSFNNLSMKLIVCDSEIKDVYTIGNGDTEKISKLRIRGGGGTSHKPVYDYVIKNMPNVRLLVNFTDGYTDLDELDDSINTLWVICKNGVSEDKIPFGEVVKLD